MASSTSSIANDMPMILESQEGEIIQEERKEHHTVRNTVMSILKKPFAAIAETVGGSDEVKHTAEEAASHLVPSIKPYTHLLDEYLNFAESEEPYSTRADQMGLHIGSFLVEHAKFIETLEEIRSHMEKESHLPIRITYFKNWASNLHESNGLLLYLKPNNIDQVQRAVRIAKKYNVKVGCGGSYHSWSPLFPDKCSTEQISLLINNRGITLEPDGLIDKFETKLGIHKRERIRINQDDTVTIVPGVTTGELMEVFLERGICFESDVVLMGVTYGGIMTTGCHGVGEDQTALADWITQIKLVDHNGDLKTFPDDSDAILKGSQIFHDDLMNAVKVSMGVLGIVVEMTVKVKKMTTARLHTSYPTLGSLIYGESPTLLSIIRNNWSVEILWFPYNSLGVVGGLLEGIPFINLWQPKTDQVWVRAINRDKIFVEANKLEKMKQKISDTLQHKAFGEVGNPILSGYGNLTPAIIGSGFDLVKATHKEGTTYEPMPFALHFRYGVSLAPAYDMEFAFPFSLHDGDDCFDTIYEAMRFVVEKSKEYAVGGILGLEKEFPLSTTMELRVIRKSNTLLCPATKRPGDDTTHTAYLEILSFGGTKNYQKFFEEVGEKWMSLGGVPHWCKQWTFLEGKGILKHMHEFYGENLVKFREVLKLLNKDEETVCGWSDIFVNSSMKNILGLNEN